MHACVLVDTAADNYSLHIFGDLAGLIFLFAIGINSHRP